MDENHAGIYIYLSAFSAKLTAKAQLGYNLGRGTIMDSYFDLGYDCVARSSILLAQ